MFFFLLFFQFFVHSLAEKPTPVVEGYGGEVTIKVEEDVYALTEDNFDVIVLSKSIILIQFFAHWCAHCRALAKPYAEAAAILAKDRPPIPLAKVDATAEEALARRHGVDGFPTLFVFRNGTKEEYTGGRTSQAIVEYMRQKADPNWRPPPETVVTLTADTFDDVIRKEELLLVEFFAPGCGHCTRLAPEYERAAKRLKTRTEPIKLAKIDATVETALAKRFAISGFPTLLVVRRGKVYPYRGTRDESGIVAQMTAEALPPSALITCADGLRKALTPNWPTIVGFFQSSGDLLDVFLDTAFAERHHNFKFIHILDPNVTQEVRESVDSVVLFVGQWFVSEYESSRYRLPLNSSITAEDISFFIGNHSRPLVGWRTPAAEWLYAEKWPKVVVYYDVDFSAEHRTHTQLIRRQVLTTGHQFKGRITFCIAREDQYSEELKDLSLDDSGEEVAVGFQVSNKVRYAMSPTERFDARALHVFVEDVLSGRVERTIKSSAARSDGPVVAVNGQTFGSLVTDSEKNVFLLFYAFGCGQCRQLEPIYRQLALKYAERTDLLVAKIEATANDFPDLFRVSAFPTIYLIPRHDKSNPLLFVGSRTLEELSAFVESALKPEEDNQRNEL